MMKRNLLAVLVILCGAAWTVLPERALSAAEGWGAITGQIVFDGEAPEQAPIQVTKDPAVCGKFQLKEEKLIVNPSNGGLANVGVWLSVGRTDRVKPTIHPELEALANERVKVDNKECRFEPHMSVVWTKQTVELANSDPVGHNMNVATLNNANPPLNQLIPAGKSMDHLFKGEETLPVKVSCNIHPWMNGWLIVRDTPYATVSDLDGKFKIENVPAGKWKFRFWQEEIGYLQDVTIDGKAQKWKKGEVEVVIKDGETIDLGVVQVKKKK